MAYMNQEKKAKIAPAVKAILKKYNVKGSLSVRNHLTLVLTIKSGTIDFIGNFNSVNTNVTHFRPATDNIQINEYWYQDHFDGIAKEFLSEIIPAMNAGNHDNSDIQSDYFDVGFYTSINVGNWDQPYTLVK